MLNGQVAIITGAGKSAGIGKAIALKLVAQGATAVLIDIEKSAALMSTIKTINANGGKAIAMECDIADTNQINQCVEVILRQYQRIDILINNAGISGSVPYFLDISDDVWDAFGAASKEVLDENMGDELFARIRNSFDASLAKSSDWILKSDGEFVSQRNRVLANG